jgi:two-component system NarL family sensor kinase
MQLRRVAATGVAAALTAASLAASVLAAVLATRAGAWDLAGTRDLPVDLVIGVTFPLCGLLALAGAQPVRAVAALLVGCGAAAATAGLSTVVAASAEEVTAAVSWAAQLQSFIWVPAFVPIIAVVPLVFPDGRLPSPRWRPALVAAVVGMVLLAAGTALHPDPFQGIVTVPKPVVSEALAAPLFLAGSAVLVPQAVAALTAMVLRWRRAEGLARRQMSVLLLAVSVVAVDVAVTAWLTWPTSVVLQAVAVALFPAALTVAVTRHRLYDLDTALARLLSGTVLGVCLAGIYLTLFSLLGALLPSGGLAASVVAAGLSGLALAPLAGPVTRAVDRGYYGDRARPEAVLADLADRLRTAVSADEVAAAVTGTVRERLRLPVADLELLLDAEARGAADARVVVLRHRDEEVGLLRVEPRAGEQRLDPRDRELLEVVAVQAAPALAAVRLSARLQRSREQLVAAREEERLRLRRDLHDGVGAALAGVRLQLESARERVDDPLTGRMLDAAATAVVEAVDGVRHVTDDLRPPALDELGLAACLRLLAERMTGPGTTVDARVGEVGGLGTATEVACYRIAAEALTNARRHAGARAVAMELHEEGGHVVLSVCDDGTGLPDEVRPGAVGLESMRLRAEELGGRLEVRSAAGGTTVEARLPVVGS